MASSSSADCAMLKLTCTTSPVITVTSCSCVAYPIRSTRTVCVPVGTFRIRNWPLELASAPRPVPGTDTCAPDNGRIVTASVT